MPTSNLEALLKAMRPYISELELHANNACPGRTYLKICDLVRAYDALARPILEKE